MKHPTRIVLYVNYNPAYLYFAGPCIKSLIDPGCVDPEAIDFVVFEKFASSEAVDLVRKLGANVIVVPGYKAESRYAVAQETFARWSDCNTLLCLDVDTVLTEKCRFLERIESMLQGYSMAGYTYQHPNPGGMLVDREFLWNPRFKCNDPAGAYRVERMIHGLFSITADQFRQFLLNRKWYYGGFQIIGRGALHEPCWPAMVAATMLTGCDETVLAMARASIDAPDWLELDHGAFPHRVCPDTFNLHGPGMLHYASTQYRERFKKEIEQLYQDAKIYASALDD